MAYPLLGAEALYIVTILILRPYKSTLHTVGMFMGEIVVLYALALVLISNYAPLSEESEVLLIFIL
jgi:hypothetical protein